MKKMIVLTTLAMGIYSASNCATPPFSLSSFETPIQRNVTAQAPVSQPGAVTGSSQPGAVTIPTGSGLLTYTPSGAPATGAGPGISGSVIKSAFATTQPKPEQKKWWQYIVGGGPVKITPTTKTTPQQNIL